MSKELTESVRMISHQGENVNSKVASLVTTQLVKNLPAMQETWVGSLVGRCLGERNSYLLQYSGLENYMDKEA